MNSSNSPTIEELETIRQQLVQQIKEALQLFGSETNRAELLTSKAALKNIEELMKRMQKPRKRNVAKNRFLAQVALPVE